MAEVQTPAPISKRTFEQTHVATSAGVLAAFYQSADMPPNAPKAKLRRALTYQCCLSRVQLCKRREPVGGRRLVFPPIPPPKQRDMTCISPAVTPSKSSAGRRRPRRNHENTEIPRQSATKKERKEQRERALRLSVYRPSGERRREVEHRESARAPAQGCDASAPGPACAQGVEVACPRHLLFNMSLPNGECAPVKSLIRNGLPATDQ